MGADPFSGVAQVGVGPSDREVGEQRQEDAEEEEGADCEDGVNGSTELKNLAGFPEDDDVIVIENANNSLQNLSI